MANKSTKKNKMVIDSTNNIESLETTLPTSTEVSETSYITFDQLKEELVSGKKLADILTFRKYLPIIEKQLLVERILGSIIDIDNGIKKVNYVLLNMYEYICLLETYSDYSFTQDSIIEEYDYMMENGIVDIVVEDCLDYNEYYFITNTVEKEVGQLKVDNSMESILNNHLWLLQDKLEGLFAKVPQIDQPFIEKAMTKFGKIVGKFSPENVKEIKNLYEYSKGGK